MEQLKTKKFHHLNLVKIFFAALPTIVFGVFTIIFTLQQNASAKATREQDQRQADEINQRIIFKEYIDDMKELLFDENFTKNMTKSLLQMRIQTLTALRNLDANRKHDIIVFLYENDLIRHDKLPNIELRGADLTDVKFDKSSTEICDLTNISLPGIYAKNIKFDSCFLTFARFDDALMSNAKFHSCQLTYANFNKTNLTYAQFYDNQLHRVNFTNAFLTYTSIKGGVFQNINLTNTDLYKSDINDQLLYPLKYDGIAPNILINTRFPNGSFTNISNENLFDKVKSQCHQNTTVSWRDLYTQKRLTIIDSNQISLTNIFEIKNDCFFVLDHNQTTINGVRPQIFSLLIYFKQAMFHFSALIGLKNANINDEISLSVHFAQDEGTFDYSRSVKKSIKKSYFDTILFFY